jgi:hypothetical protein
VIVKQAHLQRLHRMLAELDRHERQQFDEYGPIRPGSIRASRRRDAEALRRVLQAIDDHLQQSTVTQKPALSRRTKPAAARPFSQSAHQGDINA